MAPGWPPPFLNYTVGEKEGERERRRTQYVILIVSKSHRRSEFENSWKKGRRGEDLSLPDVYNKGTISPLPVTAAAASYQPSAIEIAK